VEGAEGERHKWESQIKLYELLQWPGRALAVAALYLPIKAAQPIAESFAGKNTNVTLTISVTLALSVMLGAGFLAQARKIRDQRRELQRLRRRITTLEDELEGSE